MYDYDPCTSSFEFTLRMAQSRDGKGAVHLTPISKIVVDGQQLGLISSIELRASAQSNLPKLRVGVLEGLMQEGFERSSAELKKSAREVVAQLRRFPLVELVTPEYLR